MVNPMNGQRITVEQAINISLQHIPGQIMQVNLDMDDGILKYEVYILTSYNKIFEVEVNAKTGQIITIEQENDFD